MNILPSRWPGIVRTYEGDPRVCTVEIPGITDGSSIFPVAELEYGLGDRAKATDPKDQTEVRIVPGDLVWLAFAGGDPRFPIITGFRTARAGNPTGWRRWRHANIEITADGVMVLNATTLQINAQVQIVGDGVTHNGSNIGETHVHPGVQRGPSETDPPT